MKKKSLKKDVTLTARGVAYLRTFLDIPFSKEISDFVEGKKANKIIMGDNFEAIKSLIPIIELRYKSINKAIEIYGSKQILEIGAGFSTRGIEFTKGLNDIKYIEADLIDLIEEKKLFIKEKLKKNNGKLYFFSVENLNYYKFLKTTKIFDKNFPVTVVSEGLLAYLTFDQKKSLTTSIHKILKEYGGVWITSDISNNKRVEFDNCKDLNVGNRIQKFSSFTKGEIIKNCFKDKSSVIDFFYHKGFEVQVIKQTDFCNKISSVESFGLNKKVFKDLFNRREILILTIKN